MRLIDANQLKDVLAATSSTAEESAIAFKEVAEIALEQPLVTYNDPSELLVKDSGYPLDAIKTTSGTLSSSDTYNPALMALQCKSCGGVIDRDTMTCMHCGMTYMLVNSSEINPR
jgi:hypothetical protein